MLNTMACILKFVVVRNILVSNAKYLKIQETKATVYFLF